MKTGSRMSLLAITALLLWGCGRAEPETQDASSPQVVATQIIATGQFVSKGGQTTSGTYRIERSGGELRLVLSDDFETDEGPDLHVVLSPTATTEAQNENAMAEGRARIIAPLASLSGRQTYDVPADVELSAFASVLIHCVQFSHLYGAAPLSQ